ncbi:MAG: citrate lyase acyl carrier protein [Oscillospiraceae bacterium]|nr:citrate lyase acyl carrier protein [Oscillospiraceae bacterium]
MELLHAASAGTMESSDALVTVSPAENGISLSITSPVIHQYGEQIKKVVLERLEALEVKNAEITVVDKGALDCTLKARVEGAVFRACDAADAGIPWGGAVK